MITKLNARSSPYIEKRRGLILVCLVLIGFSGPVSANCDDSKGNLWINFTCMVQKTITEIKNIVWNEKKVVSKGTLKIPLLKDSHIENIDSVLRSGKTTISLAWMGSYNAPYHIKIKNGDDICWEKGERQLEGLCLNNFHQSQIEHSQIYRETLPRTNGCNFDNNGDRYQIEITQCGFPNDAIEENRATLSIVKHFVIDNSKCSHLPNTCVHNSDNDDLLLKKILWLKREKHCQFEAYQLFTTIPNPSPILQAVKELLETGTDTNTQELEDSAKAYFKYCSS